MKNPWLETLVIRRSVPDDCAFFRQVLAEASALPTDTRATLEQTLRLPNEQDICEDFSGAGDLSVVATDGRNVRMGAAWARQRWSDSSGDVPHTATPEVRLAVRAEFHGRGVGSALLLALLSSLGREGIKAVRIHAEKHNGVPALYERIGFEIASERAEAFVMIANLEGMISDEAENTRRSR
jgi:ribosomal protein S18 acetylase RimI-like enzyme